jgi:hypothetical protein
MRSLDQIEANVDAVLDAAGTLPPIEAANRLLGAGEDTLMNWIVARGEAPTDAEKEGFRLLALHRQGAKGEPSFNACRETCRELVYHFNLITSETDHPDTPQRVKLAALVTRHLVYFVSGKMQVESLGDFCCAAKPMRAGDELVAPYAALRDTGTDR